jgi:hypothetical protein
MIQSTFPVNNSESYFSANLKPLVQNRQVFWLKRHHPYYLPDFSVAYRKDSSFTAAGPRGICTRFPFNQSMHYR